MNFLKKFFVINIMCFHILYYLKHQLSVDGKQQDKFYEKKKEK